MGGEAWLPWAKAPQRVSLLLVCRTPCLGSMLHARTRVQQSLVRARCSLPHRVHPSEPPPLRSAYSSTRAFVSVSSSSRRVCISHPEQPPPEQLQPCRLPVPSHQIGRASW